MQRLRLRLCFLGLVWFGLLSVTKGCGPPPVCQPDARVSTLTVNPNGSPCQYKCECNNQVYTGFCNEQGFCDSIPRGDCPKLGVKDGCFVRPKPKKDGLICPSGAGIRTCQPDYLRLQKWGDCELLNKVTDENSPQTCGDGIDNDCDGKVDRSDDGCREYCFPGETKSCYTGKPKTQNVGVCAAGRLLCDPATGKWPVSKAACRFDVKPLPEVCNGKDDDCNGKVDDGLPKCVCDKEGTTQPCYTGPHSTENQGICKTGTRVCKNVDGNKYWGACQSEVLPKAKEDCNNIDDNCNGLIDEGCPCVGDAVRSCGTDVGECRKGEQRCLGGAWSKTCYGEGYPIPELCDAKDNNCNGLLDEYINPKACITTCGKGVASCKGGQWVCEGPEPKKETCDNTDEDCDGRVDGFAKSCQTSCGQGSQFCLKGSWGPCTPNKTKAEECNGKDDDCNGKVDDGLIRLCKTACGKGTDLCLAGKWTCFAPEPKSEVCDGFDNDCNGKVDDSPQCKCKPGAVQACSRAKGTCVRKADGSMNCKGHCKAGKQVCAGGQWGPCVGEILPQSEVCDNKDNDCNGQIDDQVTRDCYAGNAGCRWLPGGGYSCQSPCQVGKQTCKAGQWGQCAGQVLPQQEICDGKDNNCSGRVDEDLLKNCTTACGSGFVSCKAGKWTQCSARKPQKEICDNQDNDCNGKVDDNVVQPCKTKCGVGQQSCTLGRWSTCTAAKPQAEICDGKDNDCNGLPDDGLSRPCFSRNLGCYRTSQGSYTCQQPCKAGTQTCQSGQWSSCSGEIVPQTEICDGKDNDCNGQVDEALVQNCKSNCGTGLEFCRSGAWVNCTAPKPQKERCNGIDDDCNGKPDDNIFQPTCTGTCGKGKVVCQQGISVCKVQTVGQELCNGIDDDCNGKVDDSFPEKGKPCVDSRAKGECRQGTYTACTSGKLVCTGSLSKLEVCDNKDNDCDGKVDEGIMGCVSTVAGTCLTVGNKDGPALKAQLSSPISVQWARVYNTKTKKLDESLLIVDFGNHRIRRLDFVTGMVVTWAGSTSGFVNADRLKAKFFFPEDLAGPDEFGNFFVGEGGNRHIRQINKQGQVTSFSGIAGLTSAGFRNDSALFSKFNNPRGLFVLKNNTLIVADHINQRIRSVDRNGFAGTIAGNGGSGAVDGTLSNATFFFPADLVALNVQKYYVVDTGNSRIRVIDLVKSNVATLAGSGRGYKDGTGRQAQFATPVGIAIDSKGHLYVADTGNHCIRKVTQQGVVTTIAGICKTPGYKDGVAAKALFFRPQRMSFDAQDNLYVADFGNHCIRKIALP